MNKTLCLLSFLLFSAGSAQAQAPFFQGKTITIVVGYLAGDGYDIWTRLLAAHMGKHIPGSPNMIAQNMPGAGSMIAANYIYNVAKPEGLTMGSIGPSLYLDQLIGKKEVQFDWAKFGWVGSAENTPWLLFMKTDTPFKTIDDVRKAKQPPKCSATGSGTSGHFVPKLLDEALAAKFSLVMGYKGGAEQDLAFERGEVVCRSISIPTFFAREPFLTWRKSNLVRILMQTGRKRDPKMPDVPTIHELMNEYKTPAPTRALVAAILASGDLGRPFIVPPGVSAERLKILRDAFRKTMADPAFLADVKARKLEVDPDFGEDLETIAREAVSQPRDIVERMKKLLSE
ncbi:MAG: tripartite tricarboxylate transporter substrate-binding protein [Deltaproteobacteria bacterium]|nr:tripartite tricarboxylate transporter substrate-binding protein [Deltaproteobacteria bacterium]MDZ4347754.1 tripartite tricarboxylate transporter substrate-binding protein [Candidatus Binatia bacterium]